ncbi:MAG: PIN domain-containing protein [Opitutales bacterium]
MLVDTNIFLDVILTRATWAPNSKRCLDWCHANAGSGWLAWHTLATIYFLVRRDLGGVNSRKQVELIASSFDICPVDSRSAQLALALPMNDFEDALQAAAAQSARLDAVVTHNVSDYKGSVVPAMAPANFLKQVEE